MCARHTRLIVSQQLDPRFKHLQIVKCKLQKGTLKGTLRELCLLIEDVNSAVHSASTIASQSKP
jgi:hypothetical protein